VLETKHNLIRASAEALDAVSWGVENYRDPKQTIIQKRLLKLSPRTKIQLFCEFPPPKHLAILCAFVRNQTDYDECDNGDAGKYAEADRKHGKLLPRRGKASGACGIQ